MSKKFDIKPPIWPKELTFEEFKRFNPLINEGQLIPLYNQYLNKFLTELAELKIHFKQSLNKQLALEFQNLIKESSFQNITNYFDLTTGYTGIGGGGFRYKGFGIGSMAVGTHLDAKLNHKSFPQNGGFHRFTVGASIDNNALESSIP
tara:strand:+ start:543 stop:986 length:444 start_codon:yes stop_codon:yes gene_type:complete